MTVTRVVRVRLKRPDDATWRILRTLEREAAAYKNICMAAWWAGRYGFVRPDGQTTESWARQAWKGRLASAVVDALAREVKGAIRRLRRAIDAQDQRLPIFSSGRALICRGTDARGERGVRLWRDADGTYRLRLRLLAAAEGDAHVLSVWPDAVTRQPYLQERLARLAGGADRLSRVALVFRLRRRQLDAHLSYERTLVVPPAGARVATLGPLESSGALSLRTDTDRFDLTAWLAALRMRKGEHDKIVRRLRRQGRFGRKRWKMKTSFLEWVDSPLGKKARDVMDWCRLRGVGRINVLPIADGDWPAERFLRRLKARAEEGGVVVSDDAAMKDPSTARAVEAPVKKARKGARALSRAVATLADAIAPGAGRS